MELQQSKDIAYKNDVATCRKCRGVLFPAFEDNGGSEPQTKFEEFVGYLKCSCKEAKLELKLK